jgi:hypothetical protein
MTNQETSLGKTEAEHLADITAASRWDRRIALEAHIVLGILGFALGVVLGLVFPG